MGRKETRGDAGMTTPDKYSQIIQHNPCGAAQVLADECRIKDATITALQTMLFKLGEPKKPETRMCGQCWTEHGHDRLPCGVGCGCHEAEVSA